MTKWEYQTIEVIRGRVNQVNNKIMNKTDGKLFKGAELYTLDEYLSIIGQDGWELIVSGNVYLLSSPERVDSMETVVLIAKRPIE